MTLATSHIHDLDLSSFSDDIVPVIHNVISLLDQFSITGWPETNPSAFVMHFQGSMFGEHLKNYELQIELRGITCNCNSSDAVDTRHIVASVHKQRQEQFIVYVLEDDTYDVNPPRKYNVFHSMKEASAAFDTLYGISSNEEDDEDE